MPLKNEVTSFVDLRASRRLTLACVLLEIRSGFMRSG